MNLSLRSDFFRLERLDRIMHYSTCPKFDQAIDELESTLAEIRKDDNELYEELSYCCDAPIWPPEMCGACKEHC